MMKKLFFTAILLGTIFYSNAQETTFGAKAGVDIATVKVKFGGTTATASETGYFAGGFANIGVSESFSVQPELLFVAITDFNFLSVPILGKYSVSEKFGVLAGPSLNYYLDATEDQFKLNLDFGATYEISEDFGINAKYSMGMGDVNISGIFIGTEYKF
ncbi:porin family protein [Flavobacterium koreense]